MDSLAVTLLAQSHPLAAKLRHVEGSPDDSRQKERNGPLQPRLFTSWLRSPVVLPRLGGGKDTDKAPPPLVLLPHPPHGFDLRKGNRKKTLKPIEGV